ncbi:MAG: AbrB/MazE/SpoVT family DNA-binding domain-containing protein [Oscillospiraceae bacterium]|jgi:transcriptional pleiotropic regulator of transition state genes|nr:AbrB/MazE/SpoVT family DNA-binding domain-containing protein [Oscillospiraceae bacterium]
MNATGFIRKIDRLGRISIPKELRDILEIKNGSLLEMIVDDNKIILTKKQ